MMGISFGKCNHEVLLLEAAMVLRDNRTPPLSLAPSNAVGKTPTTDYHLAYLVATVDGGTGALHRQYSRPEDTCRFSSHTTMAS